MSAGYNNTTISKNMKGFYLENRMSRKLSSLIAVRGTIGIAKSSSYPKSFAYKLQPFILPDTALGFNLDLYNLVKDFSFDDFNKFSLTQATNLYLSFNGEIRVLTVRRFCISGSLGINFISTFASNLYIEHLTFSQNKLYSFEPVSYFDKELLVGFNTGAKLEYKLSKNYSMLLTVDKYFGDNSKSGYTKSEWISIGTGVAKHF